MCGFFVHFLDSKKNDFVEMALHHIVALYLFGGLYLMNVWEQGAVMAFLHDIADVFVNISKALSETEYANTTGAFFVTMMLVWFYTRIIVLPILMYEFATSRAGIGYCSKEIFLYLLSIMYMLHCYWFHLFFKILAKFIYEGEAEDLQSKTEAADDKKTK